jgi:hypothetical protein
MEGLISFLLGVLVLGLLIGAVVILAQINDGIRAINAKLAGGNAKLAGDGATVPTEEPAMHIRAGNRPLTPGEKIRPSRALQLFGAASVDAPKIGTIAAGALCAIVSAQPGWVFVQREDGALEGWAQVQ